MEPLRLLEWVQAGHQLVAFGAQLGHRAGLRTAVSLGVDVAASRPRGPGSIDLDGVVWLTGRPIPGVDEAVARLRGAGVRVLFATNNSAPTRAELHRRPRPLWHHRRRRATSSARPTSPPACSSPARRPSCSVATAWSRRLAAGGSRSCPQGRPTPSWSVGHGRSASTPLRTPRRAVRAGARLVGTNEDPTFPTPDGLLPGGGAILAAVATAAEATPEVAGKPHRPTADAITARVAPGELRVMVGDRPATDGALADPARHPLRPGAVGGDP